MNADAPSRASLAGDWVTADALIVVFTVLVTLVLDIVPGWSAPLRAWLALSTWLFTALSLHASSQALSAARGRCWGRAGVAARASARASARGRGDVRAGDAAPAARRTILTMRPCIRRGRRDDEDVLRAQGRAVLPPRPGGRADRAERDRGPHGQAARIASGRSLVMFASVAAIQCASALSSFGASVAALVRSRWRVAGVEAAIGVLMLLAIVVAIGVGVEAMPSLACEE